MSDLSEKFLEARVAVGFVVLFFECALVELFETEGADKMFGVELSRHGRDTATADWFVAASAKGAPFGMVMEFTERLTFVFKETSAVERLAAVLEQINQERRLVRIYFNKDIF